jgi:hypothetical protein
MAKSKVRGGAKAHRKKVEARNQRIAGEKNMMQKLFEESMRKQIEELKKKEEEAESGNTENAL